MDTHCISVPIVYDWINIMEEMKKCVYIPAKRKVHHMEDCICIKFQLPCRENVPTTIWQAVGDKIHAVTFSITHKNTCSCNWLILANHKEFAKVTPTNTVSATIGDLENLSVQCVSNCADDNLCEGTLHIVVHHLISINDKHDLNSKSVSCFLSDKDGNPVQFTESDSLVCKEIGKYNKRIDKNFLTPDGNTVSLQKVSILIRGYITVKITDLSDDTFVLCTYPFHLVKYLFLCAPDGTEIVCNIDYFSCNPCIVDFERYKNCTKVCLDINFCLNIQSRYKSVISIEGNLCEPREDWKNKRICHLKKQVLP